LFVKSSSFFRLKTAEEEMDYGLVPGNFDVIIVNDNLDDAYAKLRTFVLPEVHRTKRPRDQE